MGCCCMRLPPPGGVDDATHNHLAPPSRPHTSYLPAGPASSFAVRIGNIEDVEEREEAEEAREAETGYGGRLLAPNAAASLERADEKVDLWMAVHQDRSRPSVAVARPSVAVARAWTASLADKGAPRSGIVNARLAAAAAKAARAAAGQR